MNVFKSGLVKRMAKDMDALLTDLHETLIATLAPLVDETALRLNALLGLKRLVMAPDGVGIDETRLEDIIKMCERLSFVAVDVARAVTVRAMQLRAFFVCIIRTQLAGEGEKGYEAQLPARAFGSRAGLFRGGFQLDERRHRRLGPRVRARDG